MTIRNLEIRDADGGSVVFGGAGTAEDEDAVAGVGFDAAGVAGIVYLTRKDVVRINEWAVETLAATEKRTSP